MVGNSKRTPSGELAARQKEQETAMGIFSKFEGKVEDTFEGAAGKIAGSSISPVQIAKKAEKQMRRGKMVGAGKQFAPTLYTVLVSVDDDERLYGYYPTLAGETETYLAAKAAEHGLVMDGQPLVRFIPDESLKRGKFDVIAEAVAAPIVAQLRREEMELYGLSGDYGYGSNNNYGYAPEDNYGYSPENDFGRGSEDNYGYASDDEDDRFDYREENRKPPLPYVPEDEIDYSIDYGEYTFNSQDFEDYRKNGPAFEPISEQSEIRSQANEQDEAQPQGRGQIGQAGRAQARAQAQAQPRAQEPAAIPNTMVFPAANANANRKPVEPTSPRNEPPAMALFDTGTNRRHRLKSPRVTIGRETVNNITINDINVSREHAELCLDSRGLWTIYDLDSTNGTFVNGREVAECVLREGDRITIGMTTLVFDRA